MHSVVLFFYVRFLFFGLRIASVTWLRCLHFGFWYILVLVSTLEKVLCLVSLNRMQSGFQCSIEALDRFIGLNHQQARSEDDERYTGDGVSVQWSTLKQYQARNLKCNNFIYGVVVLNVLWFIGLKGLGLQDITNSEFVSSTEHLQKRYFLMRILSWNCRGMKSK